MLHALALRGDLDLYQPPLRKVQALVHVHSAGNAIGAHDGDFLQNIRAVLFHQTAGGGLHDTVEHAVGFLAGHDPGSLIVHAQQQGDDLAHAAAVEGGHLGGHRRGAQRIAGACHRYTGGGAGTGRNCRDAASGAAGIDPQCL